MKKLMITAVTIAACGALFADVETKTWFNDAVQAYPEGWSGEGAEKTADGLTFTDAEDVTYTTPDVATGDTAVAYKITATVKFGEENTDTVEGAKAGLCLTKDGETYYFQYIGNEGWTKSTVTADPATEYTITVLVEAGTITYKVGDDTIGTKTLELAKPATCGFKGSGVLAALTGNYDVNSAIPVEQEIAAEVATDKAGAAIDATKATTVALSDDGKTLTVNGQAISKAHYIFKAGTEDKTFTLEIDPAEAEVINEETFSAEDMSVTITTVSGFTYTLVGYDTLGGEADAVNNSINGTGEAQKLEPTEAQKTATQKFFQVDVTDEQSNK